MKKRLHLFSFLLVLVLCSLSNMEAKAQTTGQSVDDYYKLYAVFIYKFTQYFNWPSAQANGDFVIGVLGNSPITEELQKMARVKKVGERKIKVKQYPAANTIRDDCHIIFVDKDNSKELAQVLKACANKSTLIVTEKEGLAKQGAMVNFIIRNNKVQLEINRKQVERVNLQVSQAFLKVAAEVE